MIWSVIRLLCCIFLAATARAQVTIPPTARQLVLVTSPGWNSSVATVRFYEKENDHWTQRGATMGAVTGRNGMAWGLGLHKLRKAAPRKVEGDGCAPAGVFECGTVFSKTPRRFAMPTVVLTPSHEGVDDPRSRWYNQLVDRRSVLAPDWQTSEKMAASPHYSLGIWVRHNPTNKPGAGSCIYLHEWVGERSGGTAGCTVLRRGDLAWLLARLRPEKSPVLVQLPAAEVRRWLPAFVRQSD